MKIIGNLNRSHVGFYSRDIDSFWVSYSTNLQTTGWMIHMIYLDLSLTLIQLVTSIFVRPRRGEYWCVSVYVPASDIFIVLITNIDRTWMGKTNRQFRVDMWFKPNKFYGTSAPLLKLLSMFGLASPDWASRVHLASGVQGKQRVIRCNRKTRFKKKCMVVSLDMFIYVCMQTSNTVPCIMYVCTYIYIFIVRYTYIYIYVSITLHNCSPIYVYKIINMYRFTGTCMYIYIFVYIYLLYFLYLYVHIFVCLYTYFWTSMNTYLHIFLFVDETWKDLQMCFVWCLESNP